MAASVYTRNNEIPRSIQLVFDDERRIAGVSSCSLYLLRVDQNMAVCIVTTQLWGCTIMVWSSL